MYLGFLTVCLGNIPLKEKARWAAENGFILQIKCWFLTSYLNYRLRTA